MPEQCVFGLIARPELVFDCPWANASIDQLLVHDGADAAVAPDVLGGFNHVDDGVDRQDHAEDHEIAATAARMRLAHPSASRSTSTHSRTAPSPCATATRCSRSASPSTPSSPRSPRSSTSEAPTFRSEAGPRRRSFPRRRPSGRCRRRRCAGS